MRQRGDGQYHVCSSVDTTTGRTSSYVMTMLCSNLGDVLSRASSLFFSLPLSSSLFLSLPLSSSLFSRGSSLRYSTAVMGYQQGVRGEAEKWRAKMWEVSEREIARHVTALPAAPEGWE